MGTTFDYRTAKKSNEDLQNWLRRLLSTNARYEFFNTEIDGKSIVILKIERSIFTPVAFKKCEYVRIGNCTKNLNDSPELKNKLWDKLRQVKFEDIVSKQGLAINSLLNLLDYTVYFDVKNKPIPTTLDGSIYYFEEEGLVKKQDDGHYELKNIGAILFAKDMSDFPTISRKMLRVVQYKDKSKLELIRDQVFEGGYASIFDEALRYINALLPSKEVIDSSIRKTVSEYPALAIREVVANALIHQDFSISGAGPIVEVFSDRIEVSNPGVPIVEIERIIDGPPRSRNESLASLMRKLKMCEELGTGWDKIGTECENKLLPAPKITKYENSTKVILFSRVPYKKMVSDDRVHACYMHACLKHVINEQMTNTSLRNRFGPGELSQSACSRLIAITIEKGLIKPYDPNTAPRYMKYVPYWA